MSREAKILAGVIVAIAAGMIGLFVVANGNSTSAPKATGSKTAFVRPSSHKIGSGPIQLVEYGDYQCPACGAAYPVVQQIMKQYDGKVTLYFRNFPLTELHPNAQAAANAAEEAGAQGKYWEMHDKLYESQKDWIDQSASGAADKFAGYARALSLADTKVKSAAEDSTHQQVIAQDRADGDAQGVNSTPTFFVNGKKIDKNDFATLRDAIESALASGAPAGASSPAAATPTASPAR